MQKNKEQTTNKEKNKNGGSVTGPLSVSITIINTYPSVRET